MAFGFPASHETEIEVTGSHADIREAIERTFQLLSWNYSTDEGNNLYSARVPMSLNSWGADFEVSLAEEPIIHIKSRCMAWQLVDWGANKRNVENFVGILFERLSWVAAISDQPPVYLDEAGRTPVERLISSSESAEARVRPSDSDQD